MAKFTISWRFYPSLDPQSLTAAHLIIQDDLKSWYPELASKVRITLVEALPSVLPTFSKQLIDYTESTFKESKIDIMTKTMVKEVISRLILYSDIS